MAVAPGDDVLVAVEAHLAAVLGADSGRAGVTFLGTERIDVLRFGPDPDRLVQYVTVGLSRRPMTDPTAVTPDLAAGPRAELVLSLRGPQDSVLRRLAAVAAAPVVEGLVLAPGAGLDLGEPLWDGGRFPAVLVGEPELPDCGDVRFLPLLPMTGAEAAYKRVHGPGALRALWERYGADLADPGRPPVPLDRPA